MCTARRQALFVTLSARRIHQLRLNNNPKMIYDKKAYKITPAYHAGSGDLMMDSAHAIQLNQNDPSVQVQYHKTMLGEWKLTRACDAFHQGITAFQNGRHWAKLQRSHLIATANEFARYTKISGVVDSRGASYITASKGDDSLISKSLAFQWNR